MHFLNTANEIEDDRAVLRALHFFGETSRVEDAADAIHHNDYDKFLELIDESGKSHGNFFRTATQ